MESMQPFVQYGRSIRDSGVPKRFSRIAVLPHGAPAAVALPDLSIVCMTERYSGYEGWPS